MKFFNIENLILNRIRAIPAYQRVALTLWDMESYKQDIIFNKIGGLYRATSMESCVKSITESRYLLFNYRYHNVGVGHHNLGDYVQTIATRNALEYVLKGQCGKFEFWDRDSLSFYGASASKKQAFCVMQGWFSHSNNFLPSKQVIPVYLGTHLSQKAQELIQRVLCIDPSFFDNVEFGCRDLFTLKFCKENGLDSYFSRCLTLTYPRRSQNPVHRKCFLVDFPVECEHYLPQSIQKSSIRINQKLIKTNEHWTSLYRKAQDLLNLYRDTASLVVTTALHCAAPCLAMGIPVVLIAANPKENKNRFSALSGLCRIYSYDDLKARKIPFSEISNLDIEDLKELLFNNLYFSISKASGSKIDAEELKSIRKNIQMYNKIG